MNTSQHKKPSKEEIIAFLKGHFRYYTMHSWNRATSYARNVKIYRLGLTHEQEAKAYDFIEAEGTYDRINQILRDFDARHDYRFQGVFNGRSDGYIVMVRGGIQQSGYLSHCTECGQLSYAKVIPKAEIPEDTLRNYVRLHGQWTDEVYLRDKELAKLGLNNEEMLRIIKEVKQELHSGISYTANNACGRCGNHSRVNFVKPHMQIYTQPSLGIDEGKDELDGLEPAELEAKNDLVKDFDKTVDDCIWAFKDLLNNCEVIEKVIIKPKTVRVVQCSKSEEEVWNEA